MNLSPQKSVSAQNFSSFFLFLFQKTGLDIFFPLENPR
jgi:hypothetical protein